MSLAIERWQQTSEIFVIVLFGSGLRSAMGATFQTSCAKLTIPRGSACTATQPIRRARICLSPLWQTDMPVWCDSHCGHVVQCLFVILFKLHDTHSDWMQISHAHCECFIFVCSSFESCVAQATNCSLCGKLYDASAKCTPRPCESLRFAHRLHTSSSSNAVHLFGAFD